jgi:hypothetical protein
VIVTQEQLAEATGYRQRAAIKRWLRRRKIPFTEGKDGRLVTTQAALDAALCREIKTTPDFSDFAPTPQMPRQARRDLLRPP